MKEINRKQFIKSIIALFIAGLVPRILGESQSEIDPKSNFQSVYLDPKLREEFYLFLKNVYHLYPEDQFHKLILDITKTSKTDKDIYETILSKLPGIKPFAGVITYALPSLKKQKEEISSQTVKLLGKQNSYNGYMEIGTTGRYVKDLRKKLGIQGKVYILNDLEPKYSAEDLAERGQFFKAGTFIQMGNYDSISTDKIPSESLELVTNYIGFHHSPTEKLNGFISSISRVLKPGGRLVLRDHNVYSEEQRYIVALAHDVYNAGLEIPWRETSTQIRNFTSIEEIQEKLHGFGFQLVGNHYLQNGDPTKNTLMAFVKTK
ncbi:methyltransferase domain-containing protein [Leptospira selangorensis]|uniref:methyltransferase domain-containing protein n=1 Tax=Leptospira selangorensis TaxID=2484982 RepID=UPI00108335CF|nr:methyltransferase domain-containing protein [Leptospira selangorensis]TGK08295.1 methyltransferase domain-containing protein [Leptospira selangorensis]